MYYLDSRVRYSEIDVDARLSLTGIMNYMQDCSTFHSEDLGVGISYLENQGRAWLLSAWQISILRRPALGERIRVGTWPYAFKGIYGYRNYVILDEEGKYLVKANSCWFLMDLGTGRPTRVTEADVAPYGKEEPRVDMDYAKQKIQVPEDISEAGRIQVMKHQIDTNHHVNNAQYVDMAREVLPEGRTIGEIRAEYKKAAVLGDQVILMRGESPEGFVISLQDPEGGVFANVELKSCCSQ